MVFRVLGEDFFASSENLRLRFCVFVPVTTLAYHIPHIVSRSALKQMTRINTPWIVTAVKDVEAGGYPCLMNIFKYPPMSRCYPC